MDTQACPPQPTAIEEDEMDMLQSFSKHGSSGDPYAYDMDLEGLDAVALDALRSDSGSPDSDRKNQATSSQKSASPPRDAPDSPSRDEAMPTATITMDLSRGRPQTRERYPDDRTGGSYFRRDQLEKKAPTPKRPPAYELRPRRQSTRIQKNMSTSESESGSGRPPSDKERKLSAADQRRLERNAREQRRSVKIVHQIDELADMLEAAGAGASKQCKSSVLQAVGDYIHSLESKNAHLEREQCGLVSKIVSIAALARRKHDRTESTTRLDYEQLFLQSSMPMAVAALDGKFTASNDRFAHVLGLREASAVVGRSVFDLASPQHLQHVFSCIGSLLRSSEPVPRGEVHGALADTARVIAITLLRPACFAVALIEPVGVDQPRRVVG